MARKWLARATRVVLIGGGLLIGLALGVAVLAIRNIRQPDFSVARDTSPVMLADDGSVLRAFLSKDQKWRLDVSYDDIPTHYFDILIAYEDRRFRDHAGVDVLAVGRAFLRLLLDGHASSGASTLTMQVVRLATADRRTGLVGKLRQAAQALMLERRLSKRQILEHYVALAPFSGNIEGVRAASLIYFGKEPKEMTPAESALLVAISQAPAGRRPERHPEAARMARDRVLMRAVERGALAPLSLASLGQRVVVRGAAPGMLAAHLGDRLRQRADAGAQQRTLIDRSLQVRLEGIAGEALDTWPREMNAAILVVRNRDCAVRGYVGGARSYAIDGAGQFDHVRGVRSPGSTLKPLIYGMGFEALAIHPLTVATDQPVLFEGYAPRNFNEGYQGDMTIRDALIKSINTTAVTVLARVGPAKLVARLRSGGVDIRTEMADAEAGLAIGLGGAGMSLEGLTRMYSGLAAGGLACQLRLTSADPEPDRWQVLSPEAAWAVADILADVPPPPGYSVRRSRDGGRRVAYKTGTSYGFRDAWALGFDEAHTIGVWLGRSDGAATLGATGVSTAAPLLFRAFDALAPPGHDVAARKPKDSVLTRQTDVPERLRRIGVSPIAQQEHKLRILFPRTNATFAIDAEGDGDGGLPLVAAGGSPPYFWFVDGRPLEIEGQQARWRPQGSGEVTVMVMDAIGEQSAVSFWVQTSP